MRRLIFAGTLEGRRGKGKRERGEGGRRSVSFSFAVSFRVEGEEAD